MNDLLFRIYKVMQQLFCNHEWVFSYHEKRSNTDYYQCINCGKEIDNPTQGGEEDKMLNETMKMIIDEESQRTLKEILLRLCKYQLYRIDYEEFKYRYNKLNPKLNKRGTDLLPTVRKISNKLKEL